jgi:uncharacterized protein involved in response to NO
MRGEDAPVPRRADLLRTLGDEGFRLFFPLAALHAALWPLLWAVAQGFALPFEGRLSPGAWHAAEMIYGAWGAALIGFLTTAVPEWTDTKRLRGRALWALAGLWAVPRVAGLLGADALAWPAAAAEAGWLLALPALAARAALARGTDRLNGFVLWLVAFAAAGIAARVAMALGEEDAARAALRAGGLIFLGLLGLALGRITTPVTNLVLDPTEATAPFRPHPGRLDLAPALVALLVAGDLAGWSEPVRGWLAVAAGAAFLDRAAEGFVGRAALRFEIWSLAGASALAGAGLLGLGAARLGAPWDAAPALHLALMGGLGLGVAAVFSIAGLLHAGGRLPTPRAATLAAALIVAGALARALPEAGLAPWPPGPPHAAAASLWAAGFGLWLAAYWPLLSDPATIDPDRGR